MKKLIQMVLFSLVSLFFLTTPLQTDAASSNPNTTVTDNKKGFKEKIKNWKVVKKIKKIVEEDNGKMAAIVSYLTLIGWLIARFGMHEEGNSLSAFHLRQTLGLWLTGIVISVGLSILSGIIGGGIIGLTLGLASSIFSIVLLVAWVIGLLDAINEREKPVFLFGKMYQKWFKGIK